MLNATSRLPCPPTMAWSFVKTKSITLKALDKCDRFLGHKSQKRTQTQFNYMLPNIFVSFWQEIRNSPWCIQSSFLRSQRLPTFSFVQDLSIGVVFAQIGPELVEYSEPEKRVSASLTCPSVCLSVPQNFIGIFQEFHFK
jgi:hypothetical protein